MGANSPYTDGGARLAVAQYLASGPPNLTVDGYRNLQCDAAGNLCVNVKAGGGGGSGGAVTIADPTTATNQAAVLAPGGSGAFALSIQGVPGGTAVPVSGTFTTTGTVTANAGTGFPTASAPGTPGTLLTTIQGSPSGTAVPVSGVFFQATQPVSLATLPALTTGAATIGIVNAGTGFPSLTAAGVSGANLITVQGSPSGVPQPVTGTFYQTVQPISATALPLPTGAATSANQIVPGTAGTPSSQVVTVQGATSMTPFSVTPLVGGSAVSATNPLPTTAGQFARTDKSGTITAGGTAQDVFAAAAAVHGFYFQNLSTVSMYIRDDGTAASAGAGSILVPANGGYYESPPLSTPTSKLSVFCATTASAFTSKVW